jgi:hypothetical protein
MRRRSPIAPLTCPSVSTRDELVRSSLPTAPWFTAAPNSHGIDPALALYPRRPANSNTTPIMTMPDATHSHVETVSAPSVTPRNSATTGFTNE